MGVRGAPKSVTKSHKVRAQNRTTPSDGFLFDEPGSMNYRRICVAPGEDVKGKILTFSRGRPMTVILTARGAVAGASLRVPDSIEPIRCEWPFDIITLSGTFTHYDVNADGPTGRLCLMFAGRNGYCIGGAVEGALIASSRVVIYVAVFYRVPYPKSPGAEDNDGEASADLEDRVSSNAASPAAAAAAAA